MSIRGLLVDPKPNSPYYNSIWIVWQTLTIITEEILGAKGLTLSEKDLSFEKCWKLLMKQVEAWRIILQSHCTIFFLNYWLKKIRFQY